MLESFLSEYRERRQHRQQSGSVHLSTDSNVYCNPSADTVDKDPEEEDCGSDAEESMSKDDVCFTTPEDPHGEELVLNLLTTWGDKYYIGLSGIELYTNTGEPPHIAKVSPILVWMV